MLRLALAIMLATVAPAAAAQKCERIPFAQLATTFLSSFQSAMQKVGVADWQLDDSEGFTRATAGKLALLLLPEDGRVESVILRVEGVEGPSKSDMTRLRHAVETAFSLLSGEPAQRISAELDRSIAPTFKKQKLGAIVNHGRTFLSFMRARQGFVAAALGRDTCSPGSRMFLLRTPVAILIAYNLKRRSVAPKWPRP